MQEPDRSRYEKNCWFPGNTTLEAGKFWLEEGLVHAIKRTTGLQLGGNDEGQFRQDEDIYMVPCKKWRDLIPSGGHHSWWTRLHVRLYRGWYQMKHVDICSDPLGPI